MPRAWTGPPPSRWWRCRLLAAVVSVICVPALSFAEPLFDRFTIVAPGSQGGGWDQTARAMQEALVEAGVARNVDVVNSPGAGGAIGLAEFVNARRGDGSALIIGGLVMIRAIRANAAAVSLAQTTPIARLTADHEVIAVSAASDLRDFSDLVQAVRTNPSAVSWGGGSLGGADQLLLNEIGRAISVPPVQMSYVAFSGGGDVAEALASNRVSVGISGFGEFAPHIQAGRLRALAISSETRLPGTSVRTLREQGVDVTLANWRGLFAPPGIDDTQRERLLAAVDAMVASSAWQRSLERHRWTDLYLAGDGFMQFLLEEEARTAAAADPRGTQPAAHPASLRTLRMWMARNRIALGVALLLLTVLVAAGGIRFVSRQRVQAERRESDLSQRLAAAEEESRLSSAETQELLRGLSEEIDRQFEKWVLTAAEREIALLMLKGLRHKEIANIRGTSERTVRQQALTIYKKTGLEGRADLTAFFLEDLLQPMGNGAGHGTARGIDAPISALSEIEGHRGAGGQSGREGLDQHPRKDSHQTRAVGDHRRR